MSTKVPGYEETVICPYEKCHVILKHRIQTHLIKCARNNSHIKLEICPFDVTHRFHAAQKERHLEECESRVNFDRYVYKISSNNEQPVEPTPRPLPAPTRPDADEENWDHYNTPTYDPQKYAKASLVLRAPRLMTKSERRKFSDSERQRLSDLERGPRRGY